MELDTKRKDAFEKALAEYVGGQPRSQDVRLIAEILHEGMGMSPYGTEKLYALWNTEMPPFLADECRRALAALLSDFMRHWEKEFRRAESALPGNG